MYLAEDQPSLHPRRRARQLMCWGLLLLTAGLIGSWVVGGRIISPHPSIVGNPPSDFPATRVTLQSDSGSRLAGWHMRAHPPRGVVVLIHPLHGSRLIMLDRARFLRAEGYSIVMIDLQGHGESSGCQITMGHLEKHDVGAAVAFAREQHPNEPIGLIGVSLGGASALLASPLRLDAMVIESVYPTIRDAVRNRVKEHVGPLSWVPSELLLLQLKPRIGASTIQLRPIDHLSRVGCPIYPMSGTADTHTTAAETTAMFSAAQGPKDQWLVEGAGHEDLYKHSIVEYKKRVIRFFNKHLRDE